ncbi:MAG: sigma-70 family RNA polymerase sigma factor [Gemmatimonadota bacterium]
MASPPPVVAQRQARFQALVLPHLGQLLAFAERRLGNRADAEDVVQESFARAWVGFAALREEARLRAWLYQILRSALSDFTQRESRSDRMLTLGDCSALSEREVVAGEAGPFEQTAAALSRERVEELLRAIPEEFAAAVELHDLDGFRYREIAEILGVATGTVMSRIFRGRKLLAGLIVSRERQAESGELVGRHSGWPLRGRRA